MTEKNDRAVILKNFGDSLAALIAVSLLEMGDEKFQSVNAALSSRKAKITLAIDTAPDLVVVGYLRMCDGSGPLHELFRVDGSSPSGEFN